MRKKLPIILYIFFVASFFMLFILLSMCLNRNEVDIAHKIVFFFSASSIAAAFTFSSSRERDKYCDGKKKNPHLSFILLVKDVILRQKAEKFD